MEVLIVSFILMAVCLAVCALLIHNAKREMLNQMRYFLYKEAESRRNSIRIALETKESAFMEIDTRISNLENGMVPDFEQAKEAAKAVNDFNKGISAIMGYDPFEARRKAQEERGGSD